MMVNNQIEEFAKDHGADFVHFADISGLTVMQNRGFRRAILVGMVLSAEYLLELATNHRNATVTASHKNPNDEFHLKETATDQLADEIAAYLESLDYGSLSQSENSLEKHGFYNLNDQSTALPHKTVASLAGLGWIGKNDLLVTTDYGCALSMCTILTNAPLFTVKNPPAHPRCGNCLECRKACTHDAIRGINWYGSVSRDDLVDVKKCDSCLMCMVHCPFTQAYAKKNFPAR